MARAQQDINKGNSLAGIIFTATNRRLTDTRLSNLHQSAYSGGVDFSHHWKERTWYIGGKFSVSHVTGTTEAITATQTASERYFQRPDNNHTDLDVSRTSLTGTGGQLAFGKKSGNIVGDIGLTWFSPRYELNDLGFLTQADLIRQFLWIQYRVLQPKGITRWRRFNLNEWRTYDFGGNLTGSAYNVNGHTQFKNYWSVGSGITMFVHQVSNADLRGGPSIRYPGATNFWSYVETDGRKKVYAGLSGALFIGKDNYARIGEVSLDLRYQPINALSVSMSGSVSRNRNSLQWVDHTNEGGSDRYIVGEIRQTEVSMSMRFTYMVTPNLSIQYWGQPFGSSGRYDRFKLITNPRAPSYSERFAQIDQSRLTMQDGAYDVRNSNGMHDYYFQNPDFNFGQFRSNFVVRWEYIPGSTLFLVWTRERNGAFYHREPGRSPYSLEFPDKGQNIFLIKYTYRLVL